MKIQFLGTGAAEGFPAEFCSCENCRNALKIGKSEFRTRTQVLIDGKISIDFPPEAYGHALSYGADFSALSCLLVTHSHMDHFYAHDFILRGYKYAKLECEKLKIYGNASVKAVFDECTAREMRPDVLKNIEFTVIKPYDEFTFDGYRVIALPANHNKNEDCLLYYIEKDGKGYLHLHDTGVVSKEALSFLAKKGAKAQAVAFDCTFLENSVGVNARHMGLDDDIAVMQNLLSLGVIDKYAKLYITHFSHNSNPTRARLNEIEKRYPFVAAYDGLETEI